jgi:hypothetical protein
MLREFDVVRVIDLIDARRNYSGSKSAARPPQIGDIGTIVTEYDEENFAVECVAPNGSTIWLADFRAAELGLIHAAIE